MADTAEVTLYFKDGTREKFDSAKTIPASEVWNYWTFFLPTDSEGYGIVRFVNTDALIEVALRGKDEETANELPNLRVLRGENDGPVPKN